MQSNYHTVFTIFLSWFKYTHTHTHPHTHLLCQRSAVALVPVPSGQGPPQARCSAARNILCIFASNSVWIGRHVHRFAANTSALVRAALRESIGSKCSGHAEHMSARDRIVAADGLQVRIVHVLESPSQHLRIPSTLCWWQAYSLHTSSLKSMWQADNAFLKPCGQNSAI